MKKPHSISSAASRRRILLAAAAATLSCAIVAPVAAQEYPTKPITMVVPYPPGGATDVIGRLLASQLSTALGQQVIVENRGGAAGSIGAAAVARAPADGYTLLMGALTSHTIYAALNSKIARYDMEKSFAPVSIVGTVPLVFVVHPSVKANSLSELIALARSKPGTINYASAGTGSPQHLSGELFQRTANIDLVHVPYKGSGPAMTDLLGGQVQMMIETAPASQSHIKAGKLRPLAVTSAQRVPTLPDVPTAAEAGLKGFEVSSMFGLLAPAGTPPAVVNKLNTALKDILQAQEVKESMLAQGAVATYTSPADAAKAIRNEGAKWTKVIKDGNIQPN